MERNLLKNWKRQLFDWISEMNSPYFKWSRLATIALTISLSFFVYSCSKKDEFCPVIDDLRNIDAIQVVNAFDESKITYFVDLHNSYQILVKKGQIDEAYSVLSTIGIKKKSEFQNSCKVVH